MVFVSIRNRRLERIKAIVENRDSVKSFMKDWDIEMEKA
jgi:hypothetical protein